MRTLSTNCPAKCWTSSSLAFLRLLALLSIFGLGADRQLRAQATNEQADINGYRYSTVVGDLTGMRVYQLRNGLTVYLAQNTDEPRIRSIVTIRAGAAFDPADNTGLAHYLEHLLFKGTDRIGSLDWEHERPLLEEIESLYQQHQAAPSADEKQAIYQRIDQTSVAAAQYAKPGEYRELATNLGAVAMNGYTQADMTGYWCLIPSASLEHHLRLESERFRFPAYRDFQRELEIVYEEFNGFQDSVTRRKEEALNRLLYPTHPYGQQSMIGTSEHLKNPSLTAIRAYYERYYVPGNMAVILVGDLDYDPTIKLVDQYFGSFPARPVGRPDLPREEPITEPRQLVLNSPGEESVYIGFRLAGAGSRDERLAMLMDLTLNNGFAGLFDIELNAKQAVKRAGSTVKSQNDYSVHCFEGYPKQGQTLEEVRDLLLKQIHRIAVGDFEEWLMRGAASDLKKQFVVNHGTAVNLSAECMHSFKRGETWATHLAYTSELDSISKQELMDFARRCYENYAIVYIRNGVPDVVRVAKPQISQRSLNEDASSAFAEELRGQVATVGRPQFVEYESAIAKSRTSGGVEVAFVPNTKNSLFELDVIFDMGKNHDKRLELATGYCSRLGTDKYSLDDLKRQLYERGLTLSSYTTASQTVFHLEGLEEHLEHGILLLDHFLSSVQADSEVYAGYIDELLKQREATLSDPNAILNQGLLSYVLYGESSHLRDVYSAEQLRAIDPKELIQFLRGLRDYRHRIFYYGSSLDQAVTLLNSHYRASPRQDPLPEIVLESHPTSPAVYFVDVDTVQANIMVATHANLFAASTIGPSNFFSPYFDRVVSNELRENRALAYGATGAHIIASTPRGYDYAYLTAKSQADKVPEALKVMMLMMQELPGNSADVEFTKADQLKRYQVERITGTTIFWNYERIKRRGLDYDVRADQYAAVQSMDLRQMQAFFANNVGTKAKCVLIVGKRSEIDMDALKQFGEIIELSPRQLFNY